MAIISATQVVIPVETSNAADIKVPLPHGFRNVGYRGFTMTIGKLIKEYRKKGYHVKVTKAYIRVDGYDDWFPTRNMTEEWDKIHCLQWVMGLIERGVRKPITP